MMEMETDQKLQDSQDGNGMNMKFKLVESLDIMDESKLCNNKAILMGHKSTYAKLKYSMLEGMSKVSFLQSFYSSTWQDPTRADSELSDAGKELRSIKDECDTLRESIQLLTKKAQSLLEEYQNKTKLLNEKVIQFQDKKRRFEEQIKIQERLQRLMQNKHTVCTNMKQAIQERQSKLEELRDAISASEKKIVQLRSEIEERSQDKEDLAAQLTEQNLQAEKLKAYWADKMHTLKQQVNWFQELKETLDVFTGISSYKQDLKKKEVTLTFSPECQEAVLQLTIRFSITQNKRLVIQNAQLNMDFFGVEDLIKKAVDDNDIIFLIHQLSSLWYRKSSLVQSVETLRRRYPMDWLQSESKIRVILGEGGRIICNLSLPTDNESSEDIKLVSVEGTSQEVNVSQIKPTQDKASLSDWLEYLHNYFSIHP